LPACRSRSRPDLAKFAHPKKVEVKANNNNNNNNSNNRLDVQFPDEGVLGVLTFCFQLNVIFVVKPDSARQGSCCIIDPLQQCSPLFCVHIIRDLFA